MFSFNEMFHRGRHKSLQRCHNERHGVSNHQPRDCLLNRLFKAQIKENIKAARHWLLCGEFTGDRRIPRTKARPVTRKMLPFHDGIMFFMALPRQWLSHCKGDKSGQTGL